MGANSSIPYSDLYQDFLDSNCKDIMIPSDFTYSTFALDAEHSEYSKYQAMSSLTNLTGMLLQSDKSFIQVKYPKEIMHHVAGILRRGSTVEYIDPMAVPNPPWGMNLVELVLTYICTINGWEYISAQKMYGGTKEDIKYGESYKRNAPQVLENLFIGHVEHSNYIDIDPNVYGYLKKLKKYEGGDCIYWTHLMVRKMIQKNMSSIEWSVKFTSALNDITDNETEQGAICSKYIVKNMVEDLAKCKIKLFSDDQKNSH